MEIFSILRSVKKYKEWEEGKGGEEGGGGSIAYQPCGRGSSFSSISGESVTVPVEREGVFCGVFLEGRTILASPRQMLSFRQNSLTHSRPVKWKKW